MSEPFSALADDFLAITREIIWCTVTTVDAKGRPRSRVLHPIWEVRDGRPVGWIVTGKTPIKAGHLKSNPHVACSYWGPSQNVVYADCAASWAEDAGSKQHVWDLFMNTPPPIGYDLRAFGAAGPDNPGFTPLRLDPWRVQVLRFKGWTEGLTPRIWQAAPEG